MTGRNVVNGWRNTLKSADIYLSLLQSLNSRGRYMSGSNGRSSANHSSAVVTAGVGDSFPTTRSLADCGPDHVAWWFCPQRLRSYKSLGPGSSNFHFLQALHPTDINVHIEEGDPSKRVPEEWLESVVWAMPSRSRVLHLPLWAKWDDVVQHMINREEVDEILYYGDPELQKKPPPPRRTVTSSVSSWPDSEVEHNAEVLRGLERQDPPEEGAAGPKQSLSKSTTNVDVALASPPADFNTWLSEIESHLAGKPSAHGQVRDASDLGVHEPGSHLAGEPSAHGQVRDASDLGVHETVRISEARSSKIHKPPEAKKEATRKAALFKKIQTHAQDILNLLAEESGACATSLSHH